MPGGWEWIILLVIALLIFGKRLPEVGKSLGKGIVEFKKGLKNVKDEMDEVDREVDDAVTRAEKQSAKPKKAPAQLEAEADADADDEHVAEKSSEEPVREKA
ncbi:MAG: twin-arginine translocase TatA/TatE family subunit [Phycisphaera sp.]|nr:twin-arginine translocase TatA/TatE family subunit [Phycisphaera sp.]